MTNFEKYKERMLKIVDSMDEGIAVSNGVPYLCEDTPCDDCDFYCDSGSCEARFIRWLYQEYEEKPKLTEGQYHFLKALSNRTRIKICDGAVIIQVVGVIGQDNLYMSERSMNHYFSGVPDLKPNVWYEVSEIMKWGVE